MQTDPPRLGLNAVRRLALALLVTAACAGSVEKDAGFGGGTATGGGAATGRGSATGGGEGGAGGGFGSNPMFPYGTGYSPYDAGLTVTCEQFCASQVPCDAGGDCLASCQANRANSPAACLPFVDAQLYCMTTEPICMNSRFGYGRCWYVSCAQSVCKTCNGCAVEWMGHTTWRTSNGDRFACD